MDKHYFAVYRWKKTGVLAREEFIAVCSSPHAEIDVLSLLAQAEDDSTSGQMDSSDLDGLDRRHHELWHTARERHVEENTRTVDHRLQSLGVSHRARQKMLREQLAQAEHDRIRRMRMAQLERAERDYDETARQLRASADEADILASVVVHGTMRIRRGTAP